MPSNAVRPNSGYLNNCALTPGADLIIADLVGACPAFSKTQLQLLALFQRYYALPNQLKARQVLQVLQQYPCATDQQILLGPVLRYFYAYHLKSNAESAQILFAHKNYGFLAALNAYLLWKDKAIALAEFEPIIKPNKALFDKLLTQFNESKLPIAEYVKEHNDSLKQIWADQVLVNYSNYILRGHKKPDRLGYYYPLLNEVESGLLHNAFDISTRIFSRVHSSVIEEMPELNMPAKHERHVLEILHDASTAHWSIKKSPIDFDPSIASQLTQLTSSTDTLDSAKESHQALTRALNQQVKNLFPTVNDSTSMPAKSSDPVSADTAVMAKTSFSLSFQSNPLLRNAFFNSTKEPHEVAYTCLNDKGEAVTFMTSRATQIRCDSALAHALENDEVDECELRSLNALRH